MLAYTKMGDRLRRWIGPRVVLLALLWGSTGCRGIGAARGAAENGARPIGIGDRPGRQSIVLQGRLDPSEVGGVESKIVKVYEIDPDGRLVRVSERDSKPDREGYYRVTIRIRAEGDQDLLVKVERSSSSGGEVGPMAVIPSWSAVDGVMIAPPIDIETAVESDVYLAAIAGGFWLPHIGTNELRALITGRMAAELRGSRTYESDVTQMARATVAAIGAWYQVLLHPDIGLEPEQVASMLEAMAWAQVVLDAQLHSAKDSSQEEHARSMHTFAVSSAYASTGIGPEYLAVAAEASADVMRRFVPGMSVSLQAALISEAEALRAHYVVRAVEALFTRAGAGPTECEAVRVAGERLEGRILSAAHAITDVDAFVNRAWSEYRKVVQLKLNIVAGRTGQETI